MEIQLQLFDSSILKPPPRPSLSNEKVLHDIATDVYQKMVKLGLADIEEDEPDEYKDDIIDIFSDAIRFGESSYQIAKSFDSRLCWEPDHDLIDFFDSVHMIAYNKLTELVNHWVAQYNIQPQFQIGQIVTFKSYDRKDRPGEIVGIYKDTARYVVYCEELGHTKAKAGTKGAVLAYEDVSEVSK